MYLVQQGAIRHTAHGGRGEPTPVSVDRKPSVSSKEGHEDGGDGHVVAGARAMMRYSQRAGGGTGTGAGGVTAASGKVAPAGVSGGPRLPLAAGAAEYSAATATSRPRAKRSSLALQTFDLR